MVTNLSTIAEDVYTTCRSQNEAIVQTIRGT